MRKYLGHLILLFVYEVIQQPCKHHHSESVNKEISKMTYKMLEVPLPL